MFLLCVFILLLSLLLFYKFKSYKNYWSDKGIAYQESDGSNLLLIFKLLTKQTTVVGLDQETYNTLKHHPFGGIIEFGKPALLITDLDLIKRILIKDFDHFVDRQPAKLRHDPYFDQMLVNLHGQEWKDVRSQLTPTFTSGKIKRMFSHFNSCGKNLVDYVKIEGHIHVDGINVQEAVGRFIVDVIGATAFGMETNTLKEKDSMFLKMAKQLMDFSTMRIIKSLMFLNFPKLFYLLGLRISSKEALDFLTAILSQALKEREQSLSSSDVRRRDDFLQLIVEARKNSLSDSDSDTKEQFEIINPETKPKTKKNALVSDDLVMSQSLMFFLAGMDTTTGLITFALYIMALQPDLQEKVRQEVNLMCGEDEAEFLVNYEVVTKLEYLDMFISEIQRQYPTGSKLKRLCTEDYIIPGSNFVIEKGMSVTIPVQGIHHDERYYPNPNKFDPERFSQENSANRHSCAYLPFGLGPRNCIGMRFALIESKVAILHLVRNFTIEPTEKTPIPLQIDTKIGLNAPIANLHLSFVPRL